MGSLIWVDPETPRTASPPVTIGMDVGQRHDPTAIVITEGLKRDVPGLRRPEWHFATRHMGRLPLGTPYPDVAARVVEIVENILKQPRNALVSPPKITLVVDATGVGTPVIDILRNELNRHGLKATISEATFTHGDRLNGHYGSKAMSVGKAYLVSRLQALFQTTRIQLPANHPEAAVMVRELQDYEIRVTEDANDRYGAFKVGTHDDLVTALGLAVLNDPQGRNGFAIGI